MTKRENKDYYANRIYVYDAKDSMVRTTVDMLKRYYAGIKENVQVVKWYMNNGKVMISVRRA